MNKFFRFLIPFLAFPLASSAQSLDLPLAKLQSYDAGQDNAALITIEQYVDRISGDPSQRRQTAGQLAAILGEPKTTVSARLFICQQLRIVGGNEQVPLLASMLKSADTSDMARLALQAIPGETAAQALKNGLAGCRDKELIGVINSLGARRETGATAELNRLLSDKDPLVASAAAQALGNIGTPEAARALISPQRPELNAALWDALLRCAQRLAAHGFRKEALDAYATLAKTGSAVHQRVALLAGKVRTDAAGSLPELVKHLESSDPDLQAQSAALTPLILGEAATRQLAVLLPELNPLGQCALLDALACRGDRGAAGAVSTLVTSPEPSVQVKAMEALGKIGNTDGLETMIAAAVSGPSKLKQAARQALVELSAPGVDAKLRQLAGSGLAAAQCEAILALSGRQDEAGVPVLLRAAESQEAAVQKASLEALTILAGPEHFASLISILAACAGSPAGESAEHATITVARRIQDPGARTQPLLVKFETASGQTRCALIRVLGSLGGAEALRAVASSLTAADASVRDAAMRTLADWPDVSAADELLRLSLEAEKPVYRSLALRGYLRLALETKSGQAAWLTKALKVAKTDADKRALLGALVESGQTGALEIAARLLGDTAVGTEAASAVLALASKVGRQNPLAAEAALKNLIAKCADNTIITHAQKALSEGWSSAETIPAPYAPSTGNERLKQLAESLSAGDKLLAYLDCGVAARAEAADGIVMRLLNGKAWNFGAFPGNPAAGTAVFDGHEISCAITGLDPAKTYALGFTWWDADGGGRSQGVQFLGADEAQPVSALPVTALPSGAENKPPATIQVPVPAESISQGRTRAIFRHQTGPNAVLSELWLIETPKGSRSATQIVQATAEAQKPKPVDLSPLTEGIRILLVTGIDYPGHVWRLTAPAIKELLEKDPRLKVRIVEDPEALGAANLAQWDVVLLHFQNWEKPGPGESSRRNLKQFVENGGGLISVHFACGAWHEEWPEFQNILGRIWHGSGPGKPQHDAYGKFLVEITDKDHPITRDLGDFETTDELYTCLTGNAPIHLLAHSKSKVDENYHPQAFVRDYGKGRVFLTTLGHDVRAFTNNPTVGELLRRSCVWTANLPTQPKPR